MKATINIEFWNHHKTPRILQRMLLDERDSNGLSTIAWSSQTPCPQLVPLLALTRLRCLAKLSHGICPRLWPKSLWGFRLNAPIKGFGAGSMDLFIICEAADLSTSELKTSFGKQYRGLNNQNKVLEPLRI